MKYTLPHCVFITILFSSSATAGNIHSVLLDNSYNSFYLGANIGIASLTDKETTYNPIRDLHFLSSSGIVGGVLLGHDFTLCNRFKLGAEGFINATNVNLDDNQNYAPISSYTVKMRYNLGFRVLPGYEVIPGMVWHTILGYSYSQFSINDNGNYGIIDTHFNKGGFQFGLGLTTSLCRNIFIRTDLVYTNYSSQTSNGTTTSVPATIQAYHNDLATLEGNFSLIYKFS